jgi:hypothetical protein
MLRGDVARIKIATSLKGVVDSTVSVSVLGKRFVIRVMKEVGSFDEGRAPDYRRVPEHESQNDSGEGGSIAGVAEGGSEEGSDGDWSVGGHEVHVVQERQGHVMVPRLEVDEAKDLSVKDPNVLGNFSADVISKVNNVEDNNRAIVLVTEGADGILENVSPVGWVTNKDEVEGVCTRVVNEGMTNQTGLGFSGAVYGVGPKLDISTILRTKDGDIPLFSKPGGVLGNYCKRGGKAILGQSSSDPAGLIPVQVVDEGRGSLPEGDVHNKITDRRKDGRTKKVTRRTNPYHPYNKFSKFHDNVQRKGGAINKRKSKRKEATIELDSSSMESDPIQDTGLVEGQFCCDMEGINLEVVLSQQPEEKTNSSSSVVPCSQMLRGGMSDSGLCELLGESRATSPVRNQLTILVDKDTGEDVDIQEDIGMNFKGNGEEDVVRSVRLEVRDREKKLNWVQGHSYQ